MTENKTSAVARNNYMTIDCRPISLSGGVQIITSLCGRRDGRTICGPLRVPKSTYVTPKFFYFGCALVRRFYCKQARDGRTDGRTDRRTDRVRRNMRPPPREESRIIISSASSMYFCGGVKALDMHYPECCWCFEVF